MAIVACKTHTHAHKTQVPLNPFDMFFEGTLFYTKRNTQFWGSLIKHLFDTQDGRDAREAAQSTADNIAAALGGTGRRGCRGSLTHLTRGLPTSTAVASDQMEMR